jgi:hypothetical protein
MGTNFYWIKHQGDESIQYHIGKRSAAGRYCYDCGSTFNKDGTQSIHFSDRKRLGWNDVCPCCGKVPDDKTPRYNPVMIELGFEKPGEKPAEGIAGASSFTWTMMKHMWDLEKQIMYASPLVVDEYGREYTAKEFLDMIKRDCPIQFQLPQEGWS